MNRFVIKLFSKTVLLLLAGTVAIMGCKAHTFKDTTNLSTEIHASKKALKVPQLIKATPTSFEPEIAKMEFYNETKDSWITIHEGYACKVDLMKNERLGVVEKVMRKYLGDKPLPKGVYTKMRATIDRKRKEELKTVSYDGKAYHIAPWIKFVKDGQIIPCIAPGIAMRLGNYPPPIFNNDTPAAGKMLGRMKKMRKKGVMDTPFYNKERKKDGFIVTFTFPKPFTITNPEQDTPKLKIRFDMKDILRIDMENKICWPMATGTAKCHATLKE